jgi:hypothetical protein
MLYFICYSPWRLTSWGGLCLLLLALGLAVRSDFSAKRRATLERAQYQDARPSLDFARDIKAAISNAESRKTIWAPLVFALTVGTAMPFAIKVTKRLPSLLPGLCTLPVRHHERNP